MKTLSQFLLEGTQVKNIEEAKQFIQKGIEDKWVPKSEYEICIRIFRNVVGRDKKSRYPFYYEQKEKYGDSTALSDLYYGCVSAETPRDIISMGKKLTAAKKAGIKGPFVDVLDNTYNKYKDLAENIIKAKEYVKSSKEVREKEKEEKEAETTKKFAPTSTGESLITILHRETKELHDEYITQTRSWAQRDYNRCVEMSHWSHEKWLEKYGQMLWGKLTLSRYGRTTMDLAFGIVRQGLIGYTDMQVKHAEQHYQDSILRLAHRVKDKGLDEKNITASSSKIGVNFETTLTDGHKTVRAWTIIASGPIQKPHYRYLIK